MKSKIKTIRFRDKMQGWKRYNFFLHFCPPDSVEHRLVEPGDKNVFLKGFLRNLYLRPSCHECPGKHFTSGSDITLFFQSTGKRNIINTINKYSKKTLKELVRDCIIRILVKLHIAVAVKKFLNRRTICTNTPCFL